MTDQARFALVGSCVLAGAIALAQSSVDRGTFAKIRAEGLERSDVAQVFRNMDTVERLQERDIQQAAITMAWFAYNAAMQTERIPRPNRSGQSMAVPR